MFNLGVVRDVEFLDGGMQGWGEWGCGWVWRDRTRSLLAFVIRLSITHHKSDGDVSTFPELITFSLQCMRTFGLFYLIRATPSVPTVYLFAWSNEFRGGEG